MKLKLWNRLILGIGAVFVTLVGVAVFLLGLLVDGIPLQGLTQQPATLSRWVVIACGLLLFLFGLYVLSLPSRQRRDKGTFIVQQTATGELRISLRAMESLVQKCLVQHSEMVLKGLSIENRRDGVIIDLKLALAGNVIIPQAVAALQKQVRDQVLASSGVDIKEVRVSVDTADGIARESPFIIPKNVAPAPQAVKEPLNEANEPLAETEGHKDETV